MTEASERLSTIQWLAHLFQLYRQGFMIPLIVLTIQHNMDFDPDNGLFVTNCSFTAALNSTFLNPCLDRTPSCFSCLFATANASLGIVWTNIIHNYRSWLLRFTSSPLIGYVLGGSVTYRSIILRHQLTRYILSRCNYHHIKRCRPTEKYSILLSASSESISTSSRLFSSFKII